MAESLSIPLEELDCPLCMRMYYDPVSLPACAHTFCRSCLARALESKRQCPLCRAPSEADALARPTDALLARLLERFAGEAYKERASEAAVERRARKPRYGVFVSDAHVPPGGARVSLFVFEPRYRVMVARAMATSRRFLMVADDGGAPAAYGCVMRVERCVHAPDGRSRLEAVPEQRAAVGAPQEEEGGMGLVSMEADAVVDEPVPGGEAGAAAVAHLAETLAARVAALPGSARMARVHGEPPAGNPAELSLWVCRAVGGRPALLQDCLLSPSVAERLRLAVNLCDEAAGGGGAGGFVQSLRRYPGILTALVLAALWYLGLLRLPDAPRQRVMY